MQTWQARWPVAALILVLAATACSEKKPADKPAAQPATPAAQAPGAAGTQATEKHVLALTNYAKSPVTVIINGEWVGQWDQNVQAPLATVQKGKNDLVVEVGGEAKGQITLTVYAVRDNQNVSLMALNFDGKPGKHTFSFGAK